MLRQAIEALRTGDRAHARDLLTRLLKADQKNAEYWVWLSAVVDTQKERLYCLQTALQLDPQNAAAKRGMLLLGAIPPDDSVPPFPVNRPRRWEEQLAISHEGQEKLVGWANPLTRVFIILGIAVVVLGLALGGYLLRSKERQPGHSRHSHPSSHSDQFAHSNRHRSSQPAHRYAHFPGPYPALDVPG